MRVQVLRNQHKRQAGQVDAPTQDMYGDCQVMPRFLLFCGVCWLRCAWHG